MKKGQYKKWETYFRQCEKEIFFLKDILCDYAELRRHVRRNNVVFIHKNVVQFRKLLYQAINNFHEWNANLTDEIKDINIVF
jgi:hypothetical protein